MTTSSSSLITNCDLNCMDYFKRLKDDKEFGLIIYKINKDYNSIIVESTLQYEDTTYEKMISSISESNCCYLIYNFQYKEISKNNEIDRNTLFFIEWAGYKSSTKDKMYYHLSKQSLLSLIGINNIQSTIKGTDFSEIEKSILINRPIINN